MPDGPGMHPVTDDHATRKPPQIKARLARRPHRHVPFTATSASRIDRVERRFAERTRKRLQRGVHRATAGLEADIKAFIEAHDEDPTPCRRVKSANETLASVRRFCKRTEQSLCTGP